MVSPDQSSDDPSVRFGRDEALWVFDMARSVEEDVLPASLGKRDLDDLAEDAVRTAIRMRRDAEEPIDGIDIGIAKSALVEKIVSDLVQ